VAYDCSGCRAVDVLAERVEVPGVQQHGRALLAAGVGGDLVDVGLAGVSAERQHRDAQLAEPRLEPRIYSGSGIPCVRSIP
jgi:hypothetical protein